MFFLPPHIPLSTTGYVLAGLLSCDPAANLSVDITFNNNPPEIKAMAPAELRSIREKEANSPTYQGEFPNVRGLADRYYQIRYSISFTNTDWPLLGRTCVQPTGVQILVTFKPTIYISSDLQPGSCMYNVTLDHEMKHVTTDIDVLGAYLPEIKKMAEINLAMIQSEDPVSRDDVETYQEIISEKFERLLNKSSEKLQEERILRQQAVDSHEEYVRLSNVCR
jgi:hypothetical protein